MTVRIGWEGGPCGVQTLHDPDALKKAWTAYPEIFGAYVETEPIVLLAYMEETAKRVNEICAAAAGLRRFVLEVE